MKRIRVFYLIGITIMTLTVSCSGGTKKESAAKSSTENESLQTEGVKTLHSWAPEQRSQSGPIM